MLQKKVVRDEENRVIGFVTEGFEGAFETLVHDAEGTVLGRVSERFATTRDEAGRLVSTKSSEPGRGLRRK